MSPSRRPRLVATDLDGTIVGWDGQVSDRTVATLKAVGELGVPVVFVTGRPARWMSEVAARTGHTGLAICANGAVLYDLSAERVVEHDPIPVEVGLHAARRLRAAIPDIAFAVESLDGFGHEPTYVARFDAGLERAVAPIESLYSQPALKLLARHESMEPDALLAVAQEVLGDLLTLTHSSTTALLEMSAAGSGRRGRGGVRRHAQRPGHAGLGRSAVRRRGRPPGRAGGGRPDGRPTRGGRRRPRARAPLRPLR